MADHTLWPAVALVYTKYRLFRSFLAFKTRPPRPPEQGCHPTELGRFVLFKILPIVGVFPFPPHEVMMLCATVLAKKPDLIVEWGTNVGVSARIFLECTRHYRIPCEIHSIDLPPSISHREHPGRLRGLLVRGRQVTLNEGDGVETCIRILQSRPRAKALVFIDGDHAKESVLREAQTLWTEFPRLPILLHDTFPNPRFPGGGPREALEELLVRKPPTLKVVESGIGPPGLTLVDPGESGRWIE